MQLNPLGVQQLSRQHRVPGGVLGSHGGIYECSLIRMMKWALAGVAQWIEHQPVNQGVASSIPGQGTCLGCGPDPRWGACERQPHIDVSLALSPSPPPL